MSQPLTTAGVGIGWRPELAADLLRAPEAVDFVEVVAETAFAHPAARREACALAEIWPVVPHGVKLSLGSAEGIDLDKARRLGALARELRAERISEHVALTSSGGREIGHLTALPFTQEAVATVARNVDAARRVMPDVPFLLENIAWTMRWPDDAIPEGDFYTEVVDATGCDLLLDVANLYANARNAGVDPRAALGTYPLDRVAMVHVAGGEMEHGFYQDTHAHAVPDEVFDLLDALFERTGPLPVVLERDARFPGFAAVRGEVDRLRAMVRAERPSMGEGVGAYRGELHLSRPDGHDAARPDLAERQSRLARFLTTESTKEGLDGFDEFALLRTRAVLQHKRVDDALPLLPRTAALGDAARALAFAALRGAPRAEALAGIADALLIARKAACDPALAEAARRDLVELRSRFVGEPGAEARPRFAPFVGKEALPDGRVVWAAKGLGREAPVHVLEFGGER